MKVPENSKARQLLEDYVGAYKRRDLPTILNLFTSDCNIWGTAIDEYRVGSEALKMQHLRDWEQSDKGEIQIVSFIPTPMELPFAAAVCRAVITIDGKENCFEHLRGTIVIKKEDSHWKIFHMHASFPDPRNEESCSFPKT